VGPQTEEVNFRAVCLVIIELLYVFASAMLDIIEEMLPNFLIFFLVQRLFVLFSSIPG
jgi:hypothetical protein